jgi:hypothetical protein
MKTYTSVAPVISMMMAQKGPKNVEDYNSMAQWESSWNIASFCTMHMLNTAGRIAILVAGP